MKFKITMAVFLLIFIIGSIIISQGSLKSKRKYEANFSAYCEFIRQLKFEGEIVSIQKTYSSGARDYIEVKCTTLEYPNISVGNRYFERINDKEIRIAVSRLYTRDYEDVIEKGDLLKSEKGDFKVYRIKPNKKKLEINILENDLNLNCE